jgi:hypothetical protein
VLRKIRGIRDAEECEDQDGDDAKTFHTARIRAGRPLRKRCSASFFGLSRF